MTKEFTMANKVRAIAITTAAAVGVGLGGYGVAAATSGSQSDPGPIAEVEEIDGIDHQFEGEEIGENVNGIPDPDEANETEEAEDGPRPLEQEGDAGSETDHRDPAHDQPKAERAEAAVRRQDGVEKSRRAAAGIGCVGGFAGHCHAIIGGRPSGGKGIRPPVRRGMHGRSTPPQIPLKWRP